MDDVKVHCDVLEEELIKLRMQSRESSLGAEKILHYSEQRRVPDQSRNYVPFTLSIPSHALEVIFQIKAILIDNVVLI